MDTYDSGHPLRVHNSNSTYFWMTVDDEDGKSVLAPQRATQRVEIVVPEDPTAPLVAHDPEHVFFASST